MIRKEACIMAEVTKKVLVLTFLCENGKELKVTINNPNVSLTGAQIKESMDSIVTSQALGDESTVSDIVSAYYVTQQQDQVALV